MTDSPQTCLFCGDANVTPEQGPEGAWRMHCPDCHACGPAASDAAQAQQRWDRAHEGERLLRTVIDESPDIILLKNWDGQFLLGNRALAALYGATPEGLAGKDGDALNPSEELAAFSLENIREVMRGGVTCIVQEASTNAESGEVRHFQSIKKPLRGPDGEPRILLIAHDITDLQRAHQTIEERERSYAYAMNAAGEGIWDWDLRHDLITHNAKWGELLGFGAEQRQHPVQDFAELLHEEDRDAAMAAVMQALAGDGVYQHEHRMRCNDGRVIWALDRGRVVERDSDGKPVRMAGSFTDITERKRFETMLMDTAAMAESANRAKSAFLANMSHEIRTPLNAIIGLAHLARGSAGDPGLRDRLDKILASGQHLLGVINDILDISKIEANKLHLEHRPFRLAEVFSTITNQLTDRAARKGLRLVFDLSADLPVHVTGDSLRLSQVLLNLCGNAIKFADSGDITLRAHLEAAEADALTLHFSVTDQGIGISQETIASLFQNFQQADDSTTRRYGGAGLGLAISKNLVGLMGGRIGIESRPGEGSVFWFTARLGRAANTAPASGQQTRPARNVLESLARTHPPRLLVAEDNVVNQEVALGLLEAAGLQADLAQNGAEAAELARRNAYDLIFMDVQMPVMDGIEATRAIRARTGGKRPKIIAMTANAMAQDREICLAAGMDDFLGKPLDPEIFLDRLADWLKADASGPKPG